MELNTILFFIFWFFVFVKVFLFWLWLWQLKEYRLDRFRAHFETQRIKKIISSFLRVKYPKFTKKIIIIFFIGSGLAILWLFYLPGIILIVLTPLFSSILVLALEPFIVFLKNRIFKKAKQKRAQFKDLLVIGITGSYGKTSTKDFLALILSHKYKVLKTKGNINVDIGIANFVLKKLKKKHKIFICEMGAYRKGEIKGICDIVKPKIGIITGVNEQHLALFGSMENLLSAEGGVELIESLPNDGMAFFNAKNRYCVDLYEKTKGIKKFLYGQEVSITGLENIEGAKIVAKELGMSEQEISQAVEKIKNKFPGVKIKKINDNLSIIDATYSANPTGVITHLDYLKTLRQNNEKLVIIMPCLIELGSASKRVHQEIGEKINEVCNLAIIITKDYFEEIKQKAPNSLFIENPKEILEKLKSFIEREKNAIILLEGRVPAQLIEKLL